VGGWVGWGVEMWVLLRGGGLMFCNLNLGGGIGWVSY
jgi:hypothetical protein